MRILSAMCDKVPLVVILGATGAGKSQLALELAQKFGGEIISADAMQMYSGLDIATNKVSAEEQKLVKHHMIDIVDPRSLHTVVDFKNKALPIVERLLREGTIPFICGGTNYYIESLLWKVLIDDETPLLLDKKRKLEPEAAAGFRVQPEQHQQEPAVDGENFDIDLVDFEKDDQTLSTAVLYKKLKEVDPQRADQLHPHERRKIWRSLQVWRQHGIPHSELLSSQGGVLGGGLRYPASRICIIEVWSNQEVLDARCDRRVDAMINQGLVPELLDFHIRYNMERLEKCAAPDYTKGIFQCIGFKEFHSYLQLSEEDKKSSLGQELFQKGVQLMKIATRQYSRRQAKWMRSRFLSGSRESPPVYRVDSSEPARWQESCLEPASRILSAYLAGGLPASPAPLDRLLPVHREEELKRTFHCDVCDRDFLGSRQFQAHLQGSRHIKTSRSQKAAAAARGRLPPLLVLTAIEPDCSRQEAIRLLKSALELPLSQVMEAVDRLPEPSELGVVAGGWPRAEGLLKSLSLRGVGVQIMTEEKETVIQETSSH